MATEQIDMAPLRPLGIFEKFMVARSKRGAYHKVGVTAFYSYDRKTTTTTTRQNLKSVIYSALALVISRHANLSITSVGIDSSEPYFARLAYVNLGEVVTFTEIEDILEGQGRDQPVLDHFLGREHSRPWDLSVPLPLWRLHVLQQPGDESRFILCYMFHHSLGDTKSALVFHQALEEALNTTDDGTETSSKVTSPDLPLIPPLDDFIDTTGEVDGSSSAPEEAEAAWTGSTQFLPVCTKFRSLRLGGYESTELLRLCKAHDVSLTAATQAMLVVALFEKLPSEYTALRTDCPISLRQWLPAPVSALSMGILVDSFSQTHQRPNGGEKGSFAWLDDARRIKERIDRAFRERRGDGLLEKLSHIKDVEAWTVAKMGQPRTMSLELSNVGRLPSLTEERSVRINGLVFSQSAGATNAAIKVSCVTGRDGRISLGFTWQEGVAEDGFISEFLDEFQSILNQDLVSFHQMHNGP